MSVETKEQVPGGGKSMDEIVRDNPPSWAELCPSSRLRAKHLEVATEHVTQAVAALDRLAADLRREGFCVRAYFRHLACVFQNSFPQHEGDYPQVDPVGMRTRLQLVGIVLADALENAQLDLAEAGEPIGKEIK